MMHVLKSVILIGSLSLATCTFADHVTLINRYTTLTNHPSVAQENLLLAVKDLHFAESVHTVGEAMVIWLKDTGFTLAPKSKQTPALQHLLLLPLPAIHRHLNQLTVQEGLRVLVGKSSFDLTVDALTREVNFRLKKQLDLHSSKRHLT